MQNGRSLLKELICIIGRYANKITKSLKSPGRRKLIGARCFDIFLLPSILLEKIKRSFRWSDLDLSNIKQERRSTFDQFQKLSNECFQIKYDEPLNRRISKLKYSLYTLHIIQFKNNKDFLAACSVIREPGFSTFEIFDVARGKKKAFFSFVY